MSQPNQSEDTLEQGLRELHERLWQQLQSRLSWSDAERVLLEVWSSYARLLEQHVSIPQYNSPWEIIRPDVVDIWIQLAKLLGRNSPEAVRADTKVLIWKIASLIDYSPGSGRGSKVTPEEHLENVVKPYLDADQRQLVDDYIGVFHISEIHSLMKFYRTLHKSQLRKEAKK